MPMTMSPPIPLMKRHTHGPCPQSRRPTALFSRPTALVNSFRPTALMLMTLAKRATATALPPAVTLKMVVLLMRYPY